MMQDYDFTTTYSGKVKNTSLNSASTNVQPSQRVVRNILNFARCCQHLSVDGKKITINLN